MQMMAFRGAGFRQCLQLPCVGMDIFSMLFANQPQESPMMLKQQDALLRQNIRLLQGQSWLIKTKWEQMKSLKRIEDRLFSVEAHLGAMKINAVSIP